MMKKVLILGKGRIGKAIEHYFKKYRKDKITIVNRKRHVYKEPTDIKSKGGRNITEESANNKKLGADYKKLLNKKDPIDKQILKLAKQGELKVDVVWMDKEKKHFSEKYSYKHLPPRGKHTS